MNEYRRLVDQIQRTLRAAPSELGSVQRLPAKYRLACDQTNGRPRRSEEGLRLSTHSEAIERCLDEPNLIKLANIIGIPVSVRWHALLARRGLDPRCVVIVDVSAELNEAYALEKEKRMDSALRT